MRRDKVILMVCRGNIARSPVAEFFLKSEIEKRSLDKNIRVISRGVQGTSVDPIPVKFSNISLYPDLYSEAKPALDELKIDISSHVSKPITRSDAENADIIFALDRKTKKAIITLFPDLKSHVILLSELINKHDDFTDPENLIGTEKHLKVFKEIQQTVVKGFPKLLKQFK